MSYMKDSDSLLAIINFVDDSIVSGTDTPTFAPGKFLATGGSWI